MIKIAIENLSIFLVILSICSTHSQQNPDEKFRFCAVTGLGNHKRTLGYCEELSNSPDSPITCVYGEDRLDCLRKLSKNLADFAVLTSEDLITASTSLQQVLITNELRYSRDEFEYKVVAILDKSSGIKSRHDIQDKKFCHPGYGYESEWTKVLSNYFEASLVPQNCKPELTLTENRIKSSSDFFQAACKAGPWVSNDTLDQELKKKYSNLCSACETPSKCSKSDKYWGRRGSLYCLTDGSGQVSWARWDDAEAHFGLLPNVEPEAPAANYAMLCPDDTIRELNSSSPCVWVVKPWSVIASERSSAQQLQTEIIPKIRQNALRWHSILLNLMESYHVTIEDVVPVAPIETYLLRATGFLSANSFPGCHPPRAVRICATSILENLKCERLSSAMLSYGIEPTIDCLKSDNVTHCMDAISKNFADVVTIEPDHLAEAIGTYKLKTLLYETVNGEFKYLTVPVKLRRNGEFKSVGDSKGKRACFPVKHGIAWNSLQHYLNEKCYEKISGFFSKITTSKSYENGDYDALKCLVHNQGDVAFVSKNSIENFAKSENLSSSDFEILCEFKEDGCVLSWAPVGMLTIRQNSSALWIEDALEVFHSLDENFGKNSKTNNGAFKLFGRFSNVPNQLFHDGTIKFRSVPYARITDQMPRFYGDILQNLNREKCDSSNSHIPSLSNWIFTILILKYFARMF